MPHETAVVSAQVLCTPYNHAPCHFMQNHIRKVHAYLAVPCHLHFWQNDRGLLRATAVTRGGTDTEVRVSTESGPQRRKISRRPCGDSNRRPFDHESGALALAARTAPRAPCKFQSHFLCSGLCFNLVFTQQPSSSSSASLRQSRSLFQPLLYPAAIIIFFSVTQAV